MHTIYNLIILFYGLAIRAAAMFNPKAALWVKGRADWRAKLKQAIPSNKKVIWFHCASLGEFEQGRCVIEELKNQHVDAFILLTFYSPSGYEIRKNYPEADYVCSLPLDTPKNANDFLEIVKPHFAVFVKYEFWLNLLMGLNQRNIQTIFISVILRDGHFLLKNYAGLFISELKKVSKIFIQDENSKIFLDQKDFSNVVLSGDTRFDRVYDLSEQDFKDDIVVVFKGNSQLLIAGSTWEKDEELLRAVFAKMNQQNLKLIIAPHLVDAKHISKILDLFKEFIVVNYTHATTSNVVNCNVLIIDCIGKLMNMYAYGNVAYIGGGFGSGIHNTLEPAAFGLPVIFGPNFQKFNEAKQLLVLKSAFSITNEIELYNALEHCLDEKNNEVLREINSKFVFNEKGATKQIVKFMMLSI